MIVRLSGAVATGVLTLAVGSAAASAALTVTITSAPPVTSTSPDATFAFTTNEPATFTCSLDGGAAVGCSSPAFYPSLPDGSHSFTVTARNTDPRGTTFTAQASHTWRVERARGKLFVGVEGGGSVSSAPAGIACPSDCSELYTVGTTVTLTPKASTGFEFAGWSGACSGSGACAPTISGFTVVMATFRLTTTVPSVLRGDRDADGVPDGLDLCPESPRGSALLRNGCGPTELMRGGSSLLEPFEEAASKALRRGTGLPGLASSFIDIGRASRRVFETELLELDICGVSSDIREGVVMLDAAAAKAAGAITALQEATMKEARPPGTDETTEKDLVLAGYDHLRGLIDETVSEGHELRALTAAACRRLGKKVVVSGRVLDTNDAHGLLTLVGGRVLQLPAGHKGDAVWEGGRVKVVARSVKGGPAIVESVDAVIDPKVAALKTKPCVSLLIAPAQDFTKKPPILHDPRGYLSSGVLWLEEGARVAATPECAKAPAGFRYSLKVEITAPGGVKPVADDLTDTDAPVPIPLTASQTTWTLTVTERRQGNDCPPPGPTPLARRLASAGKSFPCPIVVLGGTTYKITVRAAASYGSAIYERTTFDLESHGFDSGKVIGTSNVHSSIPSASFEADGYAIVGTQSAAFLSTIKSNFQFAVWSPAWYGFPLASPLDAIGVDHYAALLWPRIVGKRNNKPFRYRAALPAIVNDLIPNCLPAVNCFYRLPWEFGTSETTVQGNGPNAFSHKGNQQFAFDFVHQSGEKIYATRGGVVGDVVESNSMTFNPCADNNGNGTAGDDEDKKADGPSNFVRIDHQDGTYSYYAHVPKNSVLPDEGDTVQRGDEIAKVGNVGRSCGPHLHYQVAIDNTNTIYGQTTQICFETETSSCYIPVKDDVLVSTNA